MTGWDVFNTLGSISITGGIAYALASLKESRQDVRDRRRLRQEALEKISDAFEQGYQATLNAIAAFAAVAYYSDERTPAVSAGRKAGLEEANRRLLHLLEARGQLSAMIGRLEMMRLPDCSRSLSEFIFASADATNLIDFGSSNPRPLADVILREKQPKLEQMRKKTHVRLAEAFHDL
jgi:hypothetical protein